jgi:hypothetical protein
LGLDLAAGTVTDGLKRLEPLFRPIQEALLQRNRQSLAFTAAKLIFAGGWASANLPLSWRSQ